MNKENVIKGLLLVNLLLLIFYVATINHRYINIDEAIIGEHAYWLQEIGMVKSNMLSGLEIKWEEHVYHYHKLFVFSGAIITKLFSFDLVNLRLVTLFFSLTFFWIMWRLIVVKSEYEGGVKLFLIIAAIILINTQFFEFSYLYRPEIMVMTFGFASYYKLQMFLKNRKWTEILIAGTFAGLAALTHLNGVVFIASGFLFLLVYKQFVKSIVFGALSTVVLGFYFIDLLTPESFQGFLHQFTNDPNLVKSDFNVFTPFLKMISEHLRLFHSAKESVFTTLLIAVLLFNYKYLYRQYKGLLIYTLLSILLLAGVAHGTTSKYGLLYFPFLTIIIGISLNRIMQINVLGKIVISVSLIVYVGFHAYYTSSNQLNYHINYRQRNQLINELTENSNDPKITNGSYVFNELDKNKVINTLIIIPFMSEYENGMDLKRLVFDDYALRSNNKYVIFDKKTDPQYLISAIDFDGLQKGDTIYQYTVKHKIDDLIVFEETNKAILEFCFVQPLH